MRSIRAWLSRFGGIFHRPRQDEDLAAEIESHLELHTEDNINRGMSPEEARREAMIQLGGTEWVKEIYRDRRGLPLLESMIQDARYGLRMLAKAPGFSAVVVLSLALGIGANTAIFTLINAVLLKMLPVAEPEQLVTIGCSADDSFAYPAYKQLRDRNQVFSGVMAFRTLDKFDVDVDGHPDLAEGQAVSGNYYSVLGVNAVAGRTIMPGDDRVGGGAPVAVISYDYWARRFNHDQSVIGKKITLNGFPFSVIGITPPEFFGLEPGNPIDVSIPLTMVGQVRPEWAVTNTRYSVLSAPFRNWLYLMARLKPGITEGQALGNIEPIFRQSMREASQGLAGLPYDSPRTRQVLLNIQLNLKPGGRGLAALRQQFSKPLRTLMAVVGLLLLIACINVANLMLARASARQREIAVRIALGAGRLRMVRQLVTETLLLAIAGSAAGLVLAFWCTNALLKLMEHSSSAVALSVEPDARVLSFTALVALVAAMLSGLVPALQSTQVNLSPALKESGRTLTGARPRARLGKALVVAQVALSLVLVIGAGLLVRSLANLKNFYPGFSIQNVLLATINPGMVGYKELQALGLHRRLLNQIHSIPGVQVVSLSDFSPLSGRFSSVLPTVETCRARPGENVWVMMNVIGPDYFRTLRTPVLLGREFTDADAAGSPKVAIINQAMAHYFFGDANPLGRRFSLPGWSGDDSWLEIVGVIRNAKYNSLREQSPLQAYIPFFQAPESGSVTLEVRSTTEPGSLAQAVRRVIHETDSRLPLFDVKTLSQQLDESLVQERLAASLSTLFGALALVLACVGLYGVMGYTVACRRNEMGVRMALGAHRRQILGMLALETVRLIGIGIGIGIPLAWAGSRLITTQLYGLGPGDPFTIAGATLLMAGVGLIAGYVPARRASQVDPIVALRYE